MLVLGLLVAIASIGVDGQRTGYQPSGYQGIGNRTQQWPTFRIASILSMPFLTEVDDAETQYGNAKYQGFIKDMLDELAKILDFKYRIQIPDDGRYGSKDGDGKWSGMMGLLQNGEADMIAADLTVTYSRHEVVDFSRPFMNIPLTILTSKSTTLDPDIGVVFEPFAPELWILIVIAYFVTGFILYVVTRVSPFENWPKVYPSFSLCDALWYTISVFFRGSNMVARAFSTRLLVVGWWFFSVAVLIMYALTLGPFLMQNREINLRFNSIEQMVEDPEFQFGVVRSGSTEYLLKNSQNPLHALMWERVQETPDISLVQSYSDGLDMVNDLNKFGLVIEGSSADYFINRNCDLYQVGNLQSRSYSLGFARGSPYRAAFSSALLQLIENGKLLQLKDKWWSSGIKCAIDSKEENTSCKNVASQLGLPHMAVPFIWLLVILVVALLMALIELLYDCVNTESTEKKGAMFTRRLKEACLCCKKAPPPNPPSTVATQVNA